MHFNELHILCILAVIQITLAHGTNDQVQWINTLIETENNGTNISVHANQCGVSVNSIKRGQFIQPADKGIFPWIARLGYENTLTKSIDWKCGGTLISPKHVITAAACFNKDLIIVRLGNQHAKVTIDIPVDAITIHPNYNSNTNHSNIAIIKLKRSVDFSKHIQPVCLPNEESDKLNTNEFGAPKPVVASWGRVQNKDRPASKELHAPQSLIIQNKVCQEKYTQIDQLKYNGVIDTTVFCAVVSGFDQDACLVDVGGPMLALRLDADGVHRFHLIGVVWNDIGCGNLFVPRIYTRIGEFTKWIQQQVTQSS